jgi:hypothetical protein
MKRKGSSRKEHKHKKTDDAEKTPAIPLLQ